MGDGGEAIVPSGDAVEIAFEVPPGAEQGHPVRIEAPDGQMIEFDLPDTATPGSTVYMEKGPRGMWRIAHVDKPLSLAGALLTCFIQATGHPGGTFQTTKPDSLKDSKYIKRPDYVRMKPWGT
mmetsp:Transcript_59155/g.166657  ORF Transcript_59155/g.166657 Transcript_59155/m.166657 type:complete len:123 (+) Transcript_59155:59-427(+)